MDGSLYRTLELQFHGLGSLLRVKKTTLKTSEENYTQETTLKTSEENYT